jgi:hypothetical protein
MQLMHLNFLAESFMEWFWHQYPFSKGTPVKKETIQNFLEMFKFPKRNPKQVEFLAWNKIF